MISDISTVAGTQTFTACSLVPLSHKCTPACSSTLMHLAHWKFVCNPLGSPYSTRIGGIRWFEAWMNIRSFDITETNFALSCICGSASTIEDVVTCRGRTNKATYTELLTTLEWIKPYFTLVTACRTLGKQYCLPKVSEAIGTTKLP